MTETRSSFGMDRLAAVLLVAGVIATWAGMRQYGAFDELPREPALTSLLIAVAASALASLLRGTIASNFATALLAVWLAALVAAVGALAVAATALLVCAALGLGWRLVPPAVPVRGAVALVTGLALIAGVVGWLLPVPIHSRGIYLVGLLLVVGLTWNSLVAAVDSLRLQWNEVAPDSPAAFGVLMVGLAGVTAWLPTIMFDDLVYHLALPMQLVHLEYYRLDPASQLWALAPWASDVIHAVPMVLAREEARGAVNLVWLVACAVLVGALGRSLGLTRTLTWLTVALFASFPLSQTLVLSMQTELPTAAAVLALALLVLHAPRLPDRRTFLLAAILCAFLMALKTSNALSVLAIGAWLLVHWRGRLPWRQLPGAIVIALLLAGSSYFFAAWLAGNPVLPLYNDIFGSEYARIERFQDARWNETVGWDIFWALTFEVREFYSGYAGAAGYVLVALSGGALMGLIKRELRGVTFAALAITILPLLFAPYFRYSYPGIALLMPVLVAGVANARPHRLLATGIAGLIVVQVMFTPNATYILRDSALEQRITDGETALIEKFAPERLVAQWLQETHQTTARVFLPDPARPYAAAFAGQAFTWAWYDHDLQERVRAFRNSDLAQDWRAFWDEHGITHVLLYRDGNAALQKALEDAESVFSARRVELWKLPEASSRDLAEERDLARQMWDGSDS